MAWWLRCVMAAVFGGFFSFCLSVRRRTTDAGEEHVAQPAQRRHPAYARLCYLAFEDALVARVAEQPKYIVRVSLR